MADFRRIGTWGFLICGLVLACSGNIESEPGGASGSNGGGAPPAGGSVPGPAGGTNNNFIDPAVGALFRLTNVEYSQVVADLLGEAADAAIRYGLPDDPRAHGFDNNAALLQVSLAHGQKYAAAAEGIAAATFASPARRAMVLTCDLAAGSSCLKSYIQTVGRRLYRRVLTAEQEANLLALATAAADPADPVVAAQTVLEAMLQSPTFLYRVQIGFADPRRAGIVGLDGFGLATRLSFFLLGTTPDDELLDAAQRGGLDTPEGVKTVVARMLLDPRGRRGVQRFYGQWLPLFQVSGPSADGDRIPRGDRALAADLVEETKRFVDSVLWQPTAVVTELLTAKYSFVNARLAALYGVPAPTADWQRVDFAPGTPRMGVLTQGSLLAAGSHTEKPSTTRRGQIVREQFLCEDIPSPPPGINAAVPEAKEGESELETFARHTTEASCAACHRLMDPIGWGLNGFDVDGKLRTTDSNGQPFSVSGRIEGMTPPEFNGPVELAQRIGGSEQFKDCFAKQLFRYAYGRTETGADSAGITELRNSFQAGGWTFTKGLSALLTSDGFRFRAKGNAP